MKLSRLGMTLMAMIPVAIALYFWSLGDVDLLLLDRDPPAEIDPTLPDFYMTDATTRQHNLSGGIDSTLVSERVEGFLDRDLLLFTQPRLEAATRQGRLWEAQAHTGSLQRDTGAMTLTGEVTFRERGVIDGAMIASDSMTYLPDSAEIRTGDRATITAPGHRISAVGLVISLDRGQLRLVSAVEGTHDPTP